VSQWLCVSVHMQNKRMAILNVGAPACGMNSAMRAFVRMIVTHKFKAVAVNQGFQGLLHDEVRNLPETATLCGRPMSRITRLARPSVCFFLCSEQAPNSKTKRHIN